VNVVVAVTEGIEYEVNVAPLVAVPFAVVTVTVPEQAEATNATICVDVNEVIEVTAMPPIFTLVAVIPIKLVPVIVIEFPAHMLEDKPVIVGEREIV
jgi:hypothetical protein